MTQTLDAPARLGDLLDEATEHLVVVEDDVPCGWLRPKRCDRTADFDLLFACGARGHEVTDRLCTEHTDRFVKAAAAGRISCHTHQCCVELVAVYPRRNA